MKTTGNRAGENPAQHDISGICHEIRELQQEIDSTVNMSHIYLRRLQLQKVQLLYDLIENTTQENQLTVFHDPVGYGCEVLHFRVLDENYTSWEFDVQDDYRKLFNGVI